MRLRAAIGDAGLAIFASGRKLCLGADAVQLYTALIYQGPGLVREILDGLLHCLDRDRCSTLADLASHR